MRFYGGLWHCARSYKQSITLLIRGEWQSSAMSVVSLFMGRAKRVGMLNNSGITSKCDSLCLHAVGR